MDVVGDFVGAAVVSDSVGLQVVGLAGIGVDDWRTGWPGKGRVAQ